MVRLTDSIEIIKLSKDEFNRELDNVFSSEMPIALRERIAMMEVAFNKEKTLLAGKLDLPLNKKLLKYYVSRATLYGSGTWTKKERQKKGSI